MTEEQEKELKEAFRCAVSISYASTEDNHASCSSFHIQPFNTHWDRKTVEEVLYSVQIYTRTWIVAPMERALGYSASEVDDTMMLDWHKKQIYLLENKQKKKSKCNPQ